MKLNEALRLVIRQSGMGVLREKRLVAFLDDCQAFDDFPAMRQVMSAVAEGGYGEKLYSLAMKENNADYLRDAAGVKESLVKDQRFRKDLAVYAVDSISFALGLIKKVSEPEDHGFDPFAGGAGEKAGTKASGSAGGARPAPKPAPAPQPAPKPAPKPAPNRSPRQHLSPSPNRLLHLSQPSLRRNLPRSPRLLRSRRQNRLLPRSPPRSRRKRRLPERVAQDFGDHCSLLVRYGIRDSAGAGCGFLHFCPDCRFVGVGDRMVHRRRHFAHPVPDLGCK